MMVVFGLVNLTAFKAFASVRVLTIMMMAVEKDGRLPKWIFHLILPWTMMIFSCMYRCCGYIYYAVKSRNVVLGWPLSKENNGSSNVQLTVSISVLYPVIMPSKVYTC